MSRVHKADFPAEQHQAQASPRLPLADGHEERPEGPGETPGQGPQASERLIEAVSETIPPVQGSRVSHSISVTRLRVRREFLFVADGFSERRRHLVVQARRRLTHRPEAGAGFTATKKVGNSVARNRSRRRLREAAASWLPFLGESGTDYVFIARQETGTCEWTGLLDEMESALISLRRRLDAGAEEGLRARTGRSPAKKG